MSAPIGSDEHPDSTAVASRWAFTTPTTRSVMVDYVVGEGDTLFGIAAEFGVDPDEIVRVNNLANPDAIFVGQTLVIPAPAEATPES